MRFETEYANSHPLMSFHGNMNFVCLDMDYLRKWFANIAEMGYTAILGEVEDKIRWNTCPECVWSEAMSKGALEGLIDYSKKRGLEPIRLLQTVGHMEYAVKHDRYLDLRGHARFGRWGKARSAQGNRPI